MATVVWPDTSRVYTLPLAPNTDDEWIRYLQGSPSQYGMVEGRYNYRCLYCPINATLICFVSKYQGVPEFTCHKHGDVFIKRVRETHKEAPPGKCIYYLRKLMQDHDEKMKKDLQEWWSKNHYTSVSTATSSSITFNGNAWVHTITSASNSTQSDWTT